LGFAGWHLVSSRLAPVAQAAPPAASSVTLPRTRASASPAAGTRGSPAPAPVPSATLPVNRPPSPRAVITPGLSTSAAFWQRDLTQVNRDEAAWEQLQMRAAQAVEAFT